MPYEGQVISGHPNKGKDCYFHLCALLLQEKLGHKKSHGERTLVGYNSQGCKRVRHDLVTK